MAHTCDTFHGKLGRYIPLKALRISQVDSPYPGNVTAGRPASFGRDKHRLDPSVGLAALGCQVAGQRRQIAHAAGLELVAVEVNHIEPHRDGSGTLLIPSSKTDQDGKGAYAWLSAETMRRLGRWLEESGITDGPVFRRIHVRRLKAREAVSPQAYEAIPGNTGNWQQRLQGAPAAAGETIYTLGTNALTRQAVAPIYRKLAEEAWARGLVEAKAGEVDALIRQLSSHSLRVGLTQDLFAAREDGVAISQTLRWKSPATALRYGAKLKVRSNSAARVLGKLRS